MNSSSQIDKIAPAIVAMQKALKKAVKDSANPFFKSHYADLESSWEACKEALQANDLSVVQFACPTVKEKHIAVETILLHSSGQWFSGVAEAPIVKDDPQAYGSAFKYLRRYSLQAAVGLVDIEDDANAASGRTTEKDAKSKPSSPSPQGKEEKKAPQDLTEHTVLSAIERVTQAKTLGGKVQYCIHAGEKYYTFDTVLATQANGIAVKNSIVKIHYVNLDDNTRGLKKIEE